MDVKPILVNNQYRASSSKMEIDQFFDPLKEVMQKFTNEMVKTPEEGQNGLESYSKKIDILA